MPPWQNREIFDCNNSIKGKSIYSSNISKTFFVVSEFVKTTLLFYFGFCPLETQGEFCSACLDFASFLE